MRGARRGEGRQPSEAGGGGPRVRVAGARYRALPCSSLRAAALQACEGCLSEGRVLPRGGPGAGLHLTSLVPTSEGFLMDAAREQAGVGTPLLRTSGGASLVAGRGPGNTRT